MKPEKINTQKKVVVIGGGSSGISVVASITKRVKGIDITVIEPGDCHYYQPAWTLVGGGLFDINKTRRSMRAVTPQEPHGFRIAWSEWSPAKNMSRPAKGRK